MPRRPEYWTLTNQRFDEIKSSLDALGEKLFDVLKNESFEKIESSRDWLGFIINRKKGKHLSVVGLSLVREVPIEFELVVREWQTENPRKTCFDHYIKEFSSIEEIEAVTAKETSIIIQQLQTTN